MVEYVGERRLEAEMKVFMELDDLGKAGIHHGGVGTFQATYARIAHSAGVERWRRKRVDVVVLLNFPSAVPRVVEHGVLACDDNRTLMRLVGQRDIAVDGYVDGISGPGLIDAGEYPPVCDVLHQRGP